MSSEGKKYKVLFITATSSSPLQGVQKTVAGLVRYEFDIFVFARTSCFLPVVQAAARQNWGLPTTGKLWDIFFIEGTIHVSERKLFSVNKFVFYNLIK